MALTHVFEYRVLPGHEAEVVGFVRHSFLAGPLPAGAGRRRIARRLSQGGPEYVAVTSWVDEEALRAGTDERGVPRSLAPKADLLAGCSSAVYRISAAAESSCDEARILRIYRATVASTDLERWQQRAQETAAALTARAGLLGIQAGQSLEASGRADSVSVVAITAWRDWESVILATGGHLDRLLLDSALIDLENEVGVEHYQMLEADGPRAEEPRAAGQQLDSSG
jgi:hypothetical protein